MPTGRQPATGPQSETLYARPKAQRKIEAKARSVGIRHTHRKVDGWPTVDLVTFRDGTQLERHTYPSMKAAVRIESFFRLAELQGVTVPPRHWVSDVAYLTEPGSGDPLQGFSMIERMRVLSSLRFPRSGSRSEIAALRRDIVREFPGRRNRESRRRLFDEYIAQVAPDAESPAQDGGNHSERARAASVEGLLPSRPWLPRRVVGKAAGRLAGAITRRDAGNTGGSGRRGSGVVADGSADFEARDAEVLAPSSPVPTGKPATTEENDSDSDVVGSLPAKPEDYQRIVDGELRAGDVSHAPGTEPVEDRSGIDDACEQTPAGVSLHGGDPDMGDLPHRVIPDDRYFTVDMHVTPDGYARIGSHLYTPEEVGDALREHGWDGEKPIRLIGCDAADNGFADRLANLLRTDVLAPTEQAWTDENGRVYSSSPERGPDGNLRPRIPPDGEWQISHRDGTRTRASEDGFVPGTRDADKHGLDPDSAQGRGAALMAGLSPEAILGQQIHLVNWDDGTYFKRFYRDYETTARRRCAEAKDQFNRVPPELVLDPRTGLWIAKDNEPPPLAPHYLKIDKRVDRGSASQAALDRIDADGLARRNSIAADKASENALSNARAAQQTNDTAGTREAVSAAEKAHSPLHREMTQAAENFGESVAREHAIPDHYPGAEPEELDGPKNGNDQFDQVWRQGDKLIVVECKSSVTTALSSRRLPNGYRAMQGTREYFLDILEKMRDHGEYNEHELKLADELQEALDHGNVEYILVQGVLDGNGAYAGYVRKIFDISE